jgi:hypothetical protein
MANVYNAHFAVDVPDTQLANFSDSKARAISQHHDRAVPRRRQRLEQPLDLPLREHFRKLERLLSKTKSRHHPGTTEYLAIQEVERTRVHVVRRGAEPPFNQVQQKLAHLFASKPTR